MSDNSPAAQRQHRIFLRVMIGMSVAFIIFVLATIIYVHHLMDSLTRKAIAASDQGLLEEIAFERNVSYLVFAAFFVAAACIPFVALFIQKKVQAAIDKRKPRRS